jgi:hypothetical protein
MGAPMPGGQGEWWRLIQLRLLLLLLLLQQFPPLHIHNYVHQFIEPNTSGNGAVPMALQKCGPWRGERLLPKI